MLTGSSTDIISSENKQPNIILGKDKLNFSEELPIIKETSVMDKITTSQHCKEVERNILCKLWENLMTELFFVKIDGYVSEVSIKSKPELLLKMIIEVQTKYLT